MVVSHDDGFYGLCLSLAWDLDIIRRRKLIPGISPNARLWRDVDLLVMGLTRELRQLKLEQRGRWNVSSRRVEPNQEEAPLGSIRLFINKHHLSTALLHDGPSLRVAD